MVKRIWDTKKMAQHDAFQLRNSGWKVRVRKIKKGWVCETVGRRKERLKKLSKDMDTWAKKEAKKAKRWW